MLKNKRGDLLDSFSFLIILIIFGIGFFVLAWTIPQISRGLANAGLNNSVEGANAINKLSNYGTSGIQNGFFFLFIGLCVAQLISAFYADTHPIWLWLYVVFLALTVIIGAYLGNVYTTISSNGAFKGFTQNMIAIVMNNIIKIVIGVGAMSMIIIFSKWAYFNGGQRI